MTMRVLHRMSIRMAILPDMAHVAKMAIAVARRVAIRRRGLRKPRRITDRAEVRRRRSNVVADRLQPLQDRLPLLPIELVQEWPQPLDERILEQRFPVGLRYKEPVQPHAQRLGNLLQRSERWRHLSAFNARQIRPRDFRARLQLTLRHAA